MNKAQKNFQQLLDIMDELREKCPWDKKQTIESIRHLTIEETYELVDAIIEKDMDGVKKELGDLMLHIVFYAKIASETKQFNIADVLQSLCEKLIHRHPHIYGDAKANSPEMVKANWEKLKLQEKDKEGMPQKKSVLEGVPKALPALIKATRIQDKARGVGFDWDNKEQVWEKVLEEIKELKEEISNNSNRIEDEFGDVLFALVNYARFINVNPEDALEKTNKTFIQRFQHLEKEIQQEGKQLENMSLEEMDVYWNKAKKHLKTFLSKAE